MPPKRKQAPRSSSEPRSNTKRKPVACANCSNPIGNSSSIMCNTCGLWVHLVNCSNLSLAEASKAKDKLKCTPCATALLSNDGTQNMDIPPDTTEAKLDMVISRLSDLSTVVGELRDTIKSLEERNRSPAATVSSLSKSQRFGPDTHPSRAISGSRNRRSRIDGLPGCSNGSGPSRNPRTASSLRKTNPQLPKQQRHQKSPLKKPLSNPPRSLRVGPGDPRGVVNLPCNSL